MPGEEQRHSVCRVEGGYQSCDEKQPHRENAAVDGGRRPATGLGPG